VIQTAAAAAAALTASSALLQQPAVATPAKLPASHLQHQPSDESSLLVLLLLAYLLFASEDEMPAVARLPQTCHAAAAGEFFAAALAAGWLGDCLLLYPAAELAVSWECG
jgi:hypothetical protein